MSKKRVKRVKDFQTLEVCGEEYELSASQVEGVCRSLNIPIENRGPVNVVDINLFDKHWKSGKPRRKMTPEHKETLANARAAKAKEKEKEEKKNQKTPN